MKRIFPISLSLSTEPIHQEPAEAAEAVWDFILRILSSQNRVVPHLLPMNLMELQLK